MIVIGLTGSIGMGKSTAAQMLRDMGVPVHDSDAVVHAMIAPHGRAIADLARHFPEAYQAGNHAIDRAALGQIVFHDETRRKILEGILHPLVWESQRNFLQEQRLKNSHIVVLDIPLLYETGGEKKVDKVIVVTAPEAVQRERVLARPGMNQAKFDGILLSQIPDAEKRARADYSVETGSGETVTRAALQKIITELTP